MLINRPQGKEDRGMIEIVFIMLGLHCLADYPLQGDFLAKFKGSNWIAMIAHCAIWTVLI
jgi:hypothetical protein